MRLAAAVFLTFVMAPALAGSLTPPGPPAPTMKALDEVEARTPIASIPYSISTPGSYYLTRSLTAIVGSGITVSASPVTIDLNGFTLDGAGFGSSGIAMSVFGGSLTVRNGFIRRWINGINAGLPGLQRLEEVTIESCSGTGANVSVASVANCKFVFNGSDGIGSGYTVEIRDSLASDNQGVGINLTGPVSIVENCRAAFNTVGGVRLGRSSTIRHSVVSENYGYGIQIDQRDFVAENEVYGNSGDGIVTAGAGECRIEGNNVMSNGGYGINSTSGGNFIVRNSARGNTSGNFRVTGVGNIAPIETGTITNAVSNVSY
jgi:parallel beta-helix repeat protein